MKLSHVAKAHELVDQRAELIRKRDEGVFIVTIDGERQDQVLTEAARVAARGFIDIRIQALNVALEQLGVVGD